MECRRLCLAALVAVAGGPGCESGTDVPPPEEGPATPVQVTFAGGDSPALSPDGASLAFTTGGNIAVMQLSNGAIDTIIEGAKHPDWNPAGELLAVGSGDWVGIVNVATKEVEVVLDATGTEADPDWSPSGDELTVTNRSPDGIGIIPYPSGELANVPCEDPDGGNCAGEGPTWSPDGDWIAFEDGVRLLKVRRSGGAGEVVVEPGEDVADVYHPAWSPNGRWIAFVAPSDGGTGSDIWVADARGSARGLWRVTSGSADWSPAWSPRSDVIYFASDRSGQTEVWKVGFTPS